jgi:hypothetical protein
MTTYGYQTTWTFTTKNDLSSTTEGTGPLYKAVAGEIGDIIDNGQAAHGLLTIGADSGDTATFADIGKMKYVAGIAVSSSGILLSPTESGYLIPADSGTWVVGKHTGADVASGIVAVGLFNFATPYFLVDCTFSGR